MKLSEVKVGERGTINNMFIAGPDTLRVMTMGLVLGSEVKVLSRTSGSIEISVEGSRMAIDKEIASKIMVV